MKNLKTRLLTHILAGLYGAALALKSTGGLTWSWWVILAPALVGLVVMGGRFLLDRFWAWH
jgi:CHASE2 domain-containing sensor protein